MGDNRRYSGSGLRDRGSTLSFTPKEMLAGRRSGDSPWSLQRCLEAKRSGLVLTWYELRTGEGKSQLLN